MPFFAILLIGAAAALGISAIVSDSRRSDGDGDGGPDTDPWPWKRSPYVPPPETPTPVVASMRLLEGAADLAVASGVLQNDLQWWMKTVEEREPGTHRAYGLLDVGGTLVGAATVKRKDGGGWAVVEAHGVANNPLGAENTAMLEGWVAAL